MDEAAAADEEMPGTDPTDPDGIPAFGAADGLPEGSRVAVALGIAGLAPQALALGARLLRLDGIDQAQVALVYGALILSFLGGSWWGIALSRVEEGRRRSILLLLGVGASLAGFCLMGPAGPQSARWLLAALGTLILGSWLVDRTLVRDGMIGAWWGRLRLALSLGLGLMTLAMAALA